MIKKFYYTEKFERNLRRLPNKNEVIQELEAFADSPLEPHYQVHELKGKRKGWLAASLGQNLRIIFKFTNRDHTQVIMHDIGTHEIYQ